MRASFIARGLRRHIGCCSAALLAISGALAGCNAIFEIEPGELAAAGPGERETEVDVEGDAGPECVLSSDCDDDSLICIFRVCSEPCRADRDCERGERCLQTDEGLACVLADAAKCDDVADCPAGSECSDGECRNDCEEDSDCLDDQECTGQRCVGSDEAVTATTDGDVTDSELDAGEQTDEVQGVDETDAEASTDGSTTDTVTDESTTDVDGTDVDTPAGTDESATVTTDTMPGGTDETGSPLPTDCNELEEGAIVCDGYGGTTRSMCQGGELVATTPCTSGDVCDPADGGCAAPATECIDRAPGAVYCSGVNRVACAASLLTAETATCSSSAHCQAGNGPDCALCLQDTFTCVGNQIHDCSPDGSEWVPTDDPPCTTGSPCNPDTGTCTSLACLEGQRRCQGDSLQECNEDLTAFEEIELCAPGLCDPVNLECDVCAASGSECSMDGSQQLVCDSAGQSVTALTCGSATPYCRGSGECVECKLDIHCPGDECSTATCNVGTGTCSTVPVASGIGCSTGVCDGNGNCVECASPSDCTADDACRSVDCVSGMCEQELRGAGATCNFDGGSVCNASGDCVECLTQATCSVTNACYTAQCSAMGACGETPAGSGTSCDFAGGRVCDGDGNCVECNGPTDCTATNACYRPTCTSERCGETFQTAGTSCSFGGGSMCDGAGDCVSCLADDDCALTDICRDGDCVDSIDTVGWRTPTMSSATVWPDDLYIRRVGRINYAATVLALGSVGIDNGANIRIALYADNGNGTGPEGPPLGQTSFQLESSYDEAQAGPSPAISLAADTYYWIAFKVNKAVSLPLASDGPSPFVGRVVPYYVAGYYLDNFYNFPGGANPGGDDVGAFAVYAEIQYTE